jgi:hypothetical protein
MNRLVVWIIALTIVLTGCTYFSDFYPAKISNDAVTYTGRDPNAIGWPCIKKATDIKEDVVTTHAITEQLLQYQLKKDQVLYGRAYDMSVQYLQEATAERTKVVGTIEQPGLLLGILLPIIGGLGGSFITKLTHYSEAELVTEITKAKNGNANQATPSTV